MLFISVKAGGMRIKGARVHEEKLSKEETESPWEVPGANEWDSSIKHLINIKLSDMMKI